MSILAAFRTRLLADAGVSALTTRVYNGYAPVSATQPYGVLHSIGGSPHGHMANAAAIGESTMQLDWYAASATSRAALDEATRNAADGWSGSSGSVSIRRIILDSPAHSIEGLDSGRESPTFRSRIDARVWFAQAEPTH